MQGTVYKELVQNRFFLLCGLFLPPFVYIAVILMELIMKAGEDGFSWEHFFSEFLADGNVFPVKIMILLIAYICMRLLSSSAFSADEFRSKSFLMASVPDGTARQMYGKYAIVFMAYALFFVSAVFSDSFIACVVFCFTGKTPPNMLDLFTLMLFVQIFLRSFDIPFNVRFGTRNGKYVRIIFFIAAALTLVMLMLYSTDFAHFYKTFVEIAQKLLNGELEEETTFCISAFPVTAIGAYYLSYRLSCKLWLKGAVNYE